MFNVFFRTGTKNVNKEHVRNPGMNPGFMDDGLLIIGLLSFWGAAVYYFYRLNNLGIILSAVLAAGVFIIIKYLRQRHNNREFRLVPPAVIKKKFSLEIDIKQLSLIVVYLALAAWAFFLLISHSTEAALASPWQALPPYFFAVYFFSTLALFAYFEVNGNFALLLVALHFFLSFSIGLFVFRLGFGFDPFIHAAALEVIDKTGQVLPKTPYYLGEYSLIMVFHKVFFIPLLWLNRFLVPLLASLALPYAVNRALGNWFHDSKKIFYTIATLLILPAGIFIITTPQNLAFIFFLLAVLYGLNIKEPADLSFIYVFSLAALVCQPIAGIPALLFSLILTVRQSGIKTIRNSLYRLLYLISAASLPLVFYYLEKSSSNAAAAGSVWPQIFSLPPSLFPNSENMILNWLYFFAFNLKFIIILLVLAGVIIAYKHRQHCRVFWFYLAMSICLFISYLLASLLPFQYLINYERANFADRILLESALFLLPFLLLVFYGFYIRLEKTNRIIKLAVVVFAALLITASLYLSYPRFDNYYNSHSFSTGRPDIDAARWIHNDASSTDYIVLANQQVSAAALHEFGFMKYYQPRSAIRDPRSAIFYYPIPTGGELYQYYLDMVYDSPSRATMEKAMALAGVNTGYFVLNKYWWAFPKILAEAKLTADSWQEIDNGDVYVFKYLK